jgi:hypothetical protein
MMTATFDHATSDIGIGFCIFANTALAAKVRNSMAPEEFMINWHQYAMDKLGVKRIAVLDWDVHQCVSCCRSTTSLTFDSAATGPRVSESALLYALLTFRQQSSSTPIPTS